MGQSEEELRTNSRPSFACNACKKRQARADRKGERIRMGQLRRV